MEESENLGTRQIEKILSREISDWIRWGRNKDYLPPSFKCPLGFLYVPRGGDREVILSRPPPINLLAVVDFEQIIVGLPAKLRIAFVMYHLNRAKINDRIVERKRSAQEMGKILGVQKRQFYTMVEQAHNQVFRKWKKKRDQENI